MMSRYFVCLIFAATLFGLSAQSSVVYAQTNQQATEPDEADQPNEENDQAASPEDEQSDRLILPLLSNPTSNLTRLLRSRKIKSNS